MDDDGNLIHKKRTQLAFNFLLQVFSDKGYRVEGRGHLERFERVISKDKCETLLPRKHEYNERG